MMTDHDRMVAHMIHRKQEVAAVGINSILLQHADKLSPEFLSAVTDINAKWLVFITGIDDSLMKDGNGIVAVGKDTHK